MSVSLRDASVPESSGTSVACVADILSVQDTSSEHASTREASSLYRGEEQALESHEVIELQTFSERKAWIEDKIKFLEKMPPIEVFIGLDALRVSAEEVPGLPTRKELQQWLVEHDSIEKETEIFDTGELTKLRQLTKAATQRNLSPVDTDVIELTLTTIYELDKLLHLLRDRSEHLELLSVRLTWEEFRTSAWIDRRTIIEDLKTFLDTRARWTPAVYENIIRPEEPTELKRRGSIASFASTTSESSVTSSGFSRSARFKLAEVLSRDAAQFAGRVTSLRHGKITAAGKVLDRLIDHSRKPVPEVILDEQDRLEEKGIAEMEHIGKFIMSIVMQWRKADEIYVETMKDKISAQNLLEEIETAKMYHPTARQNASFVSRADALIKRLSLRGNPASSSSTFPRPEHPLFSDQKDFNKSLAESLSSEIISAAELAWKVDGIAKSYRTAYEAVKRVESFTEIAQDLSITFTNIRDRLQNGVSAGDGDGSPPNLMSEACLEPSRHSAFLALLPSIVEDHTQAVKKANEVLRKSQPAILDLDHPGIDSTFKTDAVSQFQQLTSICDQAQAIIDTIKARTFRLREARGIWAVMGGKLEQLMDIRRRLGEAMERRRWRQDATDSGDSAIAKDLLATPLPSDISSAEIVTELGEITAQISREIDAPLSSLSDTLELPLKNWLLQSALGLKGLLDTTTKMAELLESIQQQTSAMRSVHEEFNRLQIQIEDVQMQAKTRIDGILAGGSTHNNAGDEDIRTSVEATCNTVDNFVQSLSDRIPFIGQPDSSLGTNFVKKPFSSVDLKLGAAHHEMIIELPFDLASLDNVVRADSNAYAMRLSGMLQSLAETTAHLHLSRIATEVDSMLSGITKDINSVTHELSGFKSSLADIMTPSNVLAALDALSKNVEDTTADHRARLLHSFSETRGLLQSMNSPPEPYNVPIHQALYDARCRAIDDEELRYKAWNDGVGFFKDELARAQRSEADRVEQLRIAEEERQREEQERLAAEEAERTRLHQERLEAEERERHEEIQRIEALRIRAEQERIAHENAEKLRLERERLEAEERQRIELDRIAKEEQQKAERDRAIAEEVEKARLHQERLDMMEKLRLAEDQLAEERRLQAQRDRIAAEVEERARARLEEERVVELHRSAERNRIAEEEQKRSEYELPKAKVSERRHRKHKEPLSTTQSRSAGSKNGNSMTGNPDNEDVFGLRLAPSDGHSKTQDMIDLQAQILDLRKRLRSISINEASRPSKSSARLPDLDRLKKMTRKFSQVSSDVVCLPSSVDDVSVATELRSLKAEVQASAELMKQVAKLAHLSEAIQMCDAALSDLLEHIDSYPASPPGVMSSPHKTLLNVSPEEQLASRLSYTRDIIGTMSAKFAEVANDSRAIAERTRILQTWSELEEMSYDRLGGKKSRPGSAISSRQSSGRNSSISVVNSRSASSAKKMSGYSNLSVSGSSQKRLLAPSHPTPRRAVSGEPQSRPLSQLSTMSSNRSTSGPLGFSVYGSTFASRQRTTSLLNSTSTPTRNSSGTPRPRAQTNQVKRSGSPTASEASSYSRSVRGQSRSSTSMSTWSRAPRNSLSGLIPKVSTPPRKPPAPRKTYVADPKNKLDVAVGDVVNKLPVGINIEGVSETWKDQSGKYWIGNQDPKLCFCRILRSQTVMVRVGGGWSELSKFIKDHFADSFRLIPESPPRPGAPEEKWISSATLLETPEIDIDPPPGPPRTPEPTFPSFSLSTPTGQSPYSIKSSSPSAKGSPLTPLQFIRRADADMMLRPVTPSKPPGVRARNSLAHTPARNSVWRP